MNTDKSTIYFSLGTIDIVKSSITNVLQVRIVTINERYLGLPNMVRRKKKPILSNLLEIEFVKSFKVGKRSSS